MVRGRGTLVHLWELTLGVTACNGQGGGGGETRVHPWELTLGATTCNGQGRGRDSCTSKGIDTRFHGVQWSGGGDSCTSMGIDTGCHGVQWSGGRGLVYIYGN